MEATATRSPARALRDDVASRLTDLDACGLTSGERTDWLRTLTDLEAMVAAARSRVLSSSPGASGTGVRRRAELVRHTGMSGFEASRAVRLADTLTAVPAAADALADGRITTGHATALASGVPWLNRPAAAVDSSLIEAACHQSADEFKATVAEWERIENGDADGRHLAARQHRKRTANWFTRDDGMIRLQADFAPDVGGMVSRSVHAFSEFLWRTEDGRAASQTSGAGAAHVDAPDGQHVPDGHIDQLLQRTTGQRNADAIVELIRRGSLPGSVADQPDDTVGPADTTDKTDPAHVADPGRTGDPRGITDHGVGRTRVDLLVSVDLARLQTALPGTNAATKATGATASRCHTSDGVALPPATVRRLACDAGLIPVVLGTKGAVLDIGRHTRNIPQAIRNALVVRDGSCTFPGCGQPDSWCDAHHVEHWADGGPTSLENLVLLCSTHHHALHEDGWGVRPSPDGNHRFRSPAGELLETRRSAGFSPRRE